MTRTAVLMLLLFAAAAFFSWQKHRTRPLAPDFELRTPEGVEIRLEDHYGQVLVLDFWASWCPPCRESIPALDRLYERYRDQGLLVYGIQVRDDVNAKEYLDHRGVDYPALVGNDSIQRSYNVTAIPTIVVVGVDGRVVHRTVGWSRGDEAKLDRVLSAYLSEVGMD